MVLCIVLGLVVGAAEWCADRYHEPAAIPCNSLYMYDYPWCWISLCSATPWPGLTQDGGWFHSIFKITVGTGRSASRYPIGFLWMIILVLLMEYRSESYKIRSLYDRDRFQ